MRKMKALVLFFSLCMIQNSFAAKVDIKSVQPAFWWAGMTNPDLQIMVYGDKIAESQISITAKSASIEKIVKGDNPNYVFVYLDVSKAQPEKFDLIFKNGKDKKQVPYELKQRNANSADRIGFNASDVIYLAMPDRFANGDPSNDVVKGMRYTKVDRADKDARHGGDIKGVEEHLDYISDLGATALWLTPVLENDMSAGSYHGYAITNYYKVDPRFGTNEDYVNMVNKAHEKGLKVVMDMVFNHCGSDHQFMTDPPFNDWFNNQQKYEQCTFQSPSMFDPHADKGDQKRNTDGWFVQSMPDLNQRNPELAKYLIQNSIWWIEYAGIDGIRQDTYPYIDYDMMAEWNKEVTAEYPDFNITGETWMSYPAEIACWQKDDVLALPKNSYLKTPMDFPLTFAMNNVFKGGAGLNNIQELLAQDVVYKDPNSLLIFFENHDTSRFFGKDTTDASVANYKQALTFLLTTRGIPEIYYGTEIGMTGDKAEGDGLIRKDFPGGWAGDAHNAFVASGRTVKQNETYDFTRNLLQWRKQNKELFAKGKLLQFVPQNGVYVYQRKYNNKSIVVMMNGSTKDETIQLDRYVDVLPQKSATDIITKKTIALDSTLTFGPREVLVLEF